MIFQNDDITPAAPGMRRLNASYSKRGAAFSRDPAPIVAWAATSEGLLPMCHGDRLDHLLELGSLTSEDYTHINAMRFDATAVTDMGGTVTWGEDQYSTTTAWLEAFGEMAARRWAMAEESLNRTIASRTA